MDNVTCSAVRMVPTKAIFDSRSGVFHYLDFHPVIFTYTGPRSKSSQAFKWKTEEYFNEIEKKVFQREEKTMALSEKS